MKFRTEINIPQGTELHYPDGVLCLGSCFAEHIGEKFEEGKFPTIINPFGILYNPASIARGLGLLLSDVPFGEKDLFLHGGLWHSWMHHGRFSSPKKGDAISGMNSHLVEARTFLARAKMLIITLGTANVYVNKSSGEIVANCHKVPTKEFDKIRLGVSEITAALSHVLDQIKERYPDLAIIFTVSPVRHIRDGLQESQRSKASLLLAIEALVREEKGIYFPSYEIVLDELRDYRFYKADMIHPNDVAVDYIWQRFRDSHFPAKTAADYKQVMKVVRGFQHRVLHPNTAGHAAFKEAQISRAEQIMRRIPVDFSKEITTFQQKKEV